MLGVCLFGAAIDFDFQGESTAVFLAFAFMATAAIGYFEFGREEKT